MGYAFYTLPDGREAGYNVAAMCDADNCTTEITRGLDYLCGEAPDGQRSDDEHGCGRYFCYPHQVNHACPRPCDHKWDQPPSAEVAEGDLVDVVCTKCSRDLEVQATFHHDGASIQWVPA